jgi:membrane protein DedA with SNARE-associated domain
VPLGIDALLIVLAAKYREIFWVFPPIMTAASLVAVGLLYWVGRSASDVSLARLVSRRRVERVKLCLDRSGAGMIAAAAVLPPPFPLTPFVLACGALDVDRWRFFLVFGVMRLIRFGTVAVLARRYGDVVLKSLESYEVQMGMLMFVLVASAASVGAAVLFWRRLPPLHAPAEAVEHV